MRKIHVSAQSDVQQYRIVLVKSHLAKKKSFFCVFSVHFLSKIKRDKSQFSYRAAMSDMNYCMAKPVVAAHVQYSNY